MSVIHFPARLRLVGRDCANGMQSPHPPARDIADLPDDLRERVLAARGVPAREPDRDPPQSAA